MQEQENKENEVDPFEDNHNIWRFELSGSHPQTIIGRISTFADDEFFISNPCLVLNGKQGRITVVGMKTLLSMEDDELLIPQTAILFRHKLAPFAPEAQAYARTVQQDDETFEKVKKQAYETPANLTSVDPSAPDIIVPPAGLVDGNGNPL